MSKYFVTAKDPFFGVSIARLDDDGILVWLGLGVEDEGYLAWLAEGNTPEEWTN